MKLNKPSKLAISIAVSQAAGIVGSIFTSSSVQTWYPTLEKPFFNPPGWLFGPVWITLYTLMGIALYIIWTNTKYPFKKKRTIYLFFAQLAFNALWSIIFFGLQHILLAFVCILILLALIIATTIKFWKVDRRAGILLLPYIVWVGFASILNISLWILNS